MANQTIPYAREPKNVPAWNGESLLGKSIVIQTEQGFGDVIQYARFIPFLKALGASKVVVLTHTSLIHLLGQMECIDQLTNMTEEGPAIECDYWIGLMSLPHYINCSLPYIKQLFPVTKHKIVGSEGYLEATPSNIPKKIGVNWAASKGQLHFVKSIADHEMLKMVGDDAYSLNPESESFFHPLADFSFFKTHFGIRINLRMHLFY